MAENVRGVTSLSELSAPDVETTRNWLLPTAFGFAGFLAAFLLFTIEPLAAKSLLPTLGGSAAVWNTAVAFFQIVLLAGYLAAHATNTLLSGRLRLWVQFGILALPALILPFSFPTLPPSGSPMLWEIGVLTLTVGAPFFALSTLSPTVQRWFSWTDHPRAGDPFFLYAASNVGSFLGLLAYPFLIEPTLGLADQAAIFRWLYLGLLLVVAVLLTRVRPSRPIEVRNMVAISWKQRRRWLAWAAVPSLTLLAVTRYISTDVASFPLLWVVPLALYLATFVVAFSSLSGGSARIAARLFPLVAVAAVTATVGVLTNLFFAMGLPLAVLVASGLMGHGRLYGDRPPVGGLTEFYLWISIGGALGGMLGAFVAPLVFDSVAEYPLALVATAALLAGTPEKRRLPRLVLSALFVIVLATALVVSEFTLFVLLVGVAGIAAYALAGRSSIFAPLMAAALVVAGGWTDGMLLAQERTFYGVYRVLADDAGNHIMVSGTTTHGIQRFEPTPIPQPLAYYVDDGPFGQLMNSVGSDASEFAVIGLGAGVLASYLGEGQSMTFFEIDPVVVELANDQDLFTLTSLTAGELDFVTGDGRLMLGRSETSFDLIIVDAFTSDAIPSHLLTFEATAGYLENLNEGGVIGFHVSNRHFDLEPVIGRVAEELGLVALVPKTQSSTESPLNFVALARRESDLGMLASDWTPARVGTDLWTDEFSNLLSVLR
jgi:hypothetical protein